MPTRLLYLPFLPLLYSNVQSAFGFGGFRFKVTRIKIRADEALVSLTKLNCVQFSTIYSICQVLIIKYFVKKRGGTPRAFRNILRNSLF